MTRKNIHYFLAVTLLGIVFSSGALAESKKCSLSERRSAFYKSCLIQGIVTYESVAKKVDNPRIERFCRCASRWRFELYDKHLTENCEWHINFVRSFFTQNAPREECGSIM